ncbi:hypothetical protein DFJ77DRAFT_467085 [Powellomyces hirtus]|nr:hypothetical protein DFJ77DRAFT_467085 [Powellomyces hirtus]
MFFARPAFVPTLRRSHYQSGNKQLVAAAAAAVTVLPHPLINKRAIVIATAKVASPETNPAGTTNADTGVATSIWRDDWTFKPKPLTAEREPYPHPPTWHTTEEQPLTRENLLSLLDGQIPAVRDRGFLALDTCKQFEKALLPLIQDYSHNLGPVMRKVGVAQFEFQAQGASEPVEDPERKESYFRAAGEAWKLHANFENRFGVNLINSMIERIAALFPEWDVAVATEGPGKTYFTGIYRVIQKSTLIHCDWSPYDSRDAGWLISSVTKQLAMNLILVPVEGGRTVVHDVQWHPEALAYRDPNTYGYDPALVAGRRNISIVPRAGDITFFNTRQMHQVFPVTPRANGEAGPTRITLSAFLGFIPPTEAGQRPRLIFWA